MCHRVHAATTCPRCVGLARGNLAELRDLVERDLPAHAANGRQTYRTHEGIPGGDAIVMLAASAPTWDAGEVRAVTTELPNDPRPPLDVFTYWSNLWRGSTDNPTGLAPTLGRTVDYLDGQLDAIAGTPVFAPLARDLARLLYQVQTVVHAGERPEVSRVPCWDCGSRLVKVWAAQAWWDHWRCPACGELYDQGRYERAQHDHLASRGADRFVPLMDAVAVMGRPEQTVRAWVRQGVVDSRRAPGGRLEVWWPDVRDRHRSTPIRKKA